MPITIGAKPSPGFSSPIELLSDCHRRIEHFLAVMMKVASEANGHAMSNEQRRALKQALDYFRNAAPRHTADEEESLFPRLRTLDSPEIRAALVEVEKLESDHEQAAKWHDEVERLATKWLSEDELVERDTNRLRQMLNNLDELYRHHIAVEDDRLFPAAAAVLNASDQAEIGSEMASRRGLGASSLPLT